MKANKAAVERALRLGQALAALTCAYEGARGGTYALDKRQFRAAIKKIMAGRSPSSRAEPPDSGLQALWKAACPACAPEAPKERRARARA